MKKECVLGDLKLLERIMWIVTVIVIIMNVYSLTVSLIGIGIALYLISTTYIYVTSDFGIVSKFNNQAAILTISSIVSSIITIVTSL